jgi:hypothetical protein
MIAKAVVEARSFGVSDFPKPKPGEPPRETFTYIDESTSRDPQMVTISVEAGLPAEGRPNKGDLCVMVMQLEQVERVVTRQDREDAGRTYNAATKQYRAKVLAFEAAPKASSRAQSEPAKAAV